MTAKMMYQKFQELFPDQKKGGNLMPIKIFPNFSALEKAVDGGMIFENGETIKVGKYSFDVKVSTNPKEREVKHVIIDSRAMEELL